MRILTAAFTLCLALPSAASENCTEDAMIVFDGSGSMGEMGFNMLGEPRIFEARRAMARAVPPIAAVRRLGLMIYGPGASECTGIDLRFTPSENAAGAVIGAIEGLIPTGDTPLTEAVAEAAEVLNYRERPGTVVLVTDGKETCGGQTCELAARLADEGPDLTVHVIGFRVQGEHFQYGEGYGTGISVAECLAEETGGQYFDAQNVEDLVAAMSVALGCPLYGRLD